MKFVRRLAHVVSMIAPLVFWFSLARPAEAQPKKAKEPTSATAPSVEPSTNGAFVVNQVLTGAPREEETSNEQRTIYRIIRWIKTPEGTTAAATVVIALFGILTWRVYWQMHHHMRVVERAYLGIHDGQGFVFRRFDKDGERVYVQFGATNRGKTPAQVIDGAVDIKKVAKWVALPADPEYPKGREDTPSAFLVTGDLLSVGWNIPLTNIERQDVRDENLILYAVGFVDYVDSFDRRHRVGFGRQYTPGIDVLRAAGKIEPDSINGSIITTPGYNYDCEIGKDGKPKQKVWQRIASLFKKSV